MCYAILQEWDVKVMMHFLFVLMVQARLHQFQDYKIDPTEGFEIEMDLGYVRFLHHPFFSKEHVIATTLERDFEEYSLRFVLKLETKYIVF
jgi:hypothetical protein